MSNLKQVYLLAGGRSSSRETQLALFRTIFKENNIGSPIIAYIGAANGDDETFFNRSADSLKAAGAETVKHVLIYPSGADLAKAKSILNSADIIYISGGDVYEGMEVLKKKRIIDCLRELREQGKPFLGVSAGSLMLAKSWVQWSNPDDDSSAELFPCLDFAPIICDVHGEEDDWEELKMALKLSKDGQIGYGIVSGAAIKVHPNGDTETLGGTVHQLIHHQGKVIRLSNLLPSI